MRGRSPSFPYFPVILSRWADSQLRFISTLNETGFLKEGEIAFPHKQSAFMKLRRDYFESPEL
jgi:N5-hydroxyornithine acetyltransferase